MFLIFVIFVFNFIRIISRFFDFFTADRANFKTTKKRIKEISEEIKESGNDSDEIENENDKNKPTLIPINELESPLSSLLGSFEVSPVSSEEIKESGNDSDEIKCFCCHRCFFC